MNDRKIEMPIKVEEIYILEDDPNFKDIIVNLKEKEIIEYIKDKLGDFEKDFKALCDEFKERFEKKYWILLSDGLCYIPEINAIIPDFKTQKLYFQDSSEYFFISLDRMPHFDEYFGEFFDRFKEPQDKLENFIVNSEEEAKVFFENKNIYRNQNNNKIVCFDKQFEGFTGIRNGEEFIYFTYNGFKYYRENGENDFLILTFPIKRLDNNIGICGIIRYWLEHKLRPMSFNSDKTKETYDLLRNLFKKNPPKPDDWFSEPDEDYLHFDRDKKDIIAKWFYEQYNNSAPQKRQQFYYLPEIKSRYDNDTRIADDEFFEKFKNEILNSDRERASFEENDFTSDIITNLKLGHWDLWDYNELIEKTGKKYVKVSLKNVDCYKRDPYIDYKKYENWAVAIDFGTKSTVVSVRSPEEQYDDNEEELEELIIPIIISKKGLDNKNWDQYENPSVIEFCNFNKFKDDYDKKYGRPNTKWEDLKVSHEAFNDISQKPYYSFMTELKSWCAKSECYTIKDQTTKKDYPFGTYLDIKEDEVDPIELYAYYLGLYINKLSDDKKIFSKYFMSFPISFEGELQSKIITSFEKGIKKSLPTALLDNPKFQKEIKIKKGLVEISLSEPAAYAITALKKYSLEDDLQTKIEDCIYYAVLDFGGGTTDFDFGIYSLNPDKEKEEYKFILKHCGKDSLEKIGGEKLLKYLAFEVFKSSKDSIFKDKYDIKWTDYDGCPIRDKEKYKDYIKPDNMHAKFNMHVMMETLRWIFEDPNNNKNDPIATSMLEGNMTLTLFDEKVNDNCGIDFDEIIKDFPFQIKLADKLKFAIKRFLNSLKDVFKTSANDCIKNIKEFHIFLAGNSSKSVLFNLLLSKYFGKDYENSGIKALSVKDFNDIWKNDIEEICNTVDDSLVKEVKEELGNKDLRFIIYPPLRTEDAKKKIEEKRKKKGNNKVYNKDDPFEPSGKTGVAYGILVSRDVKEMKYGSNFEFYVGKRDIDGFGEIVLRKGTQIGIWSDIPVAKITEGMDRYEFRYKTSAVLIDGKMKIAGTAFKTIYIDEDQKEGDLMYIRPVAKNKIEWQVVSNKNDLRTKEDVIEEHCILLD